MDKADRAKKFAAGFATTGGGMMEMLETAMLEGYHKALKVSAQEYAALCTDGVALKIPPPDRREEAKRLTDKGLSQREVAAVLGVGETTVRRDLDDAPNGALADAQITKLNGLDDTDAPNGAPSTETDDEIIYREGRKMFASDLYTCISKAATFADSSFPYDDLESDKYIADAKAMLIEAQKGFGRIIALLEEISNA